MEKKEKKRKKGRLQVELVAVIIIGIKQGS